MLGSAQNVKNQFKVYMFIIFVKFITFYAQFLPSCLLTSKLTALKTRKNGNRREICVLGLNLTAGTKSTGSKIQHKIKLESPS